MYARSMKKGNPKNNRRTKEVVSEKFEHKRSLGQNFLTSDVVPNWMVEAALVISSDTILEIGPGTGMLTRALLAKGAKIIAVEADKRAILELEKNFPAEIASGQLTLHHGDAREINPVTLNLKNHQFKAVANIPYYLSGFLLRTLLESENQPNTLTFLIQKELAFRIVRDKKESLLSLSVKAFGNPTYSKTVSRGHFNPQPKVDSAIITVSSISRNNFINFTPELFFEILHLGLGKKRKQLLANLTAKYERSLLEQTFNELGISTTVRGEDLSLDIWLALILKIHTQN
jgi:16S rRNA (adenine1518-N6/adenine1519-N6)-dimethyltransferase